MFNLSYTYGDTYVVNDGTSSQINTIWRSMEYVNGPNSLDETRSDFSIGNRILGNLTYSAEFLNHLATTISLFYIGESGRPFSYTIDNSDDLAGAPGGRDFSLLYVPNNAGEFMWDEGSATAAEQAAVLDAFINSSSYLSRRRGQYAERNGSRTPFEHVFDLKIAQELFGNLGGRRNSLEVSLDIFNVGNLLNENWGKRYNAFTSSSNGGFELIEFRRFVDPENGDFTPVYRLEINPRAIRTEDDMFTLLVKDQGTFSSRWLMQFGVRYTF